MAKKSATSKTVAIVSSDRILFGVFLAFRQAWEFLSTATVLQGAGKFSSAYGVAVFCREEIGKSKLLEKHWDASVNGEPVSAHDLNSGDMRSHEKKLRACGKVLSVGACSQGMLPDPGSSEAYEIVRHLPEINVRAREQDPDRTHLGRQHAFYVEMHEEGVEWRKPWTTFDSGRSSGEILQAESAYLLRRRELEVLKKKVNCPDSLHLPPDLTSA